jgi:hypothetical protein
MMQLRSSDGRSVSIEGTRRERQITGLLTVVFAAYLLAEPLLTFVTVRTFIDGAGVYLRLYAASYGIVLLLAVLLTSTMHKQRLGFRGSRLCDLTAIAAGIYWTGESVLGLLLGNTLGYWVSTSFNYLVPVLCYVAVRQLRTPELLDILARRAAWLGALAAPGSLLAVLYALSQGFVGAGGIIHVFPVTAGLVLTGSGSWMAGLASMLVGSLTVIFSLKRAVWGILALLPLVYLMVAGVSARRIFRLAVALVFLVGVAFMFRDQLPAAVDLEVLSARLESIQTETAGFTSGQAREDEARSIWRHTVARGTPLSALFGWGMGATYTYSQASTTGAVEEKAHDSHFTPTAWLLRGGLVGVGVNLLFYGALLSAGWRAVRSAGVQHVSWCAPYMTFFVLAVIASTTSFSLTPNPVTHLAAFLVLQRSAVHSLSRTTS